MTPRQSTTLAEALSGRIPVLLLVLEDGSVCAVVGDRARAERVAAERRAVVVECGPVGKFLDTEAQNGHIQQAKPLAPQRESGSCG
jgi:hypothetical protein